MALPDMLAAPRCGARSRRRGGLPCRQPAMANGRCRLHGGKSPGAPRGNTNAWKTGIFSARVPEVRISSVAELRRIQPRARRAVERGRIFGYKVRAYARDERAFRALREALQAELAEGPLFRFHLTCRLRDAGDP